MKEERGVRGLRWWSATVSTTPASLGHGGEMAYRALKLEMGSRWCGGTKAKLLGWRLSVTSTKRSKNDGNGVGGAATAAADAAVALFSRFLRRA